jgi:hypothetical protein
MACSCLYFAYGALFVIIISPVGRKSKIASVSRKCEGNDRGIISSIVICQLCQVDVNDYGRYVLVRKEDRPSIAGAAAAAIVTVGQIKMGLFSLSYTRNPGCRRPKA